MESRISVSLWSSHSVGPAPQITREYTHPPCLAQIIPLSFLRAFERQAVLVTPKCFDSCSLLSYLIPETTVRFRTMDESATNDQGPQMFLDQNPSSRFTGTTKISRQDMTYSNLEQYLGHDGNCCLAISVVVACQSRFHSIPPRCQEIRADDEGILCRPNSSGQDNDRYTCVHAW